ncbi:MAG: sugar phosphate isomerase/epimerase [Candidatus Limiplasma sp.]|jgi:sugar phosphate isomerase/epimerase|nr:sugar phosphate isomerase/epimerase [Candidatus Limiplasma sp.]
MNFPIGLQLYSVRDDLEKDFEGTLRKVKALGYDTVEFAGLFGHSAEEVRGLCKEIGLVPLSAHVPFVDMINDPDGVLKVYADIGCKFVVIPYLTEEYRPGQPKFQEVIDGAKLLGEKAKALGMQLCYHNHDFEFVKLNGEYALDILYKEVPADILETEVDTCWVKVAGEDPSAYLRKYTGRAHIVHLKDFAGEKSEHMYALIGIDDDKKEEEANKFEFRPVGYGKQDFSSILAAAKDAGAEWVVVEQDQPSMGKTPMECAEMSINYLNSLA